MSREANAPAQQRVADDIPGRTGSRAHFQTLATTFPDAQLELGELVAISHRGGEQQGGRTVERWASPYGFGILGQPGTGPVT